ncbi:adenylate/guanylate cyclase domain-containing protein [Mucilaginibacter sp. UR6-1]|uniref:adenylate/guanylate cyclase domain-containing protein n=1 Tax=Mucilaginibacter sp. UR6-1 TaxID=1435643 RepID=UPI001E55B9A3|nr:adenylate/guanylate cyclase domain-containing protein [Mucilaginibacter sp. UR6-1]MCC8408314.1 adenylate/guanylate cyclase domain-containing protein [Mucilaginibacter sp. UR6-1]
MEYDLNLALQGGCPAVIPPSTDTEQELAILFLDIRNFTGLMESQNAQTVIQIVRRLFTGFNQIVKNFSGRVVEVAGDNLYAVFGLQTNLRDAVNNAYQAAKTMFQTVELFNEAYAVPYYGNPLQVGVGLHSGKVFVGEFGLNAPAQLSVMGLPVNIAARLQAKTKELNNDMLISEDAFKHIENGEIQFDQQTIRLQGISYGQQVRLAGKPYNGGNLLPSSSSDLDYLLAIAG